jgi:peptidoglycan hydrolase CwlO-like protein
MLNEYLKGVNLLTINEENRLKEKVEKLEIEKSQFEALKHDFEAFKKELRSKR